MSGRLHRRVFFNLTLVLPLWTGIIFYAFWWWSFLIHFMFCILKLCILTFYAFEHFWGFVVPEVCHGDVVCHSGWASPILYIYSLGHFLTTKGALIDGDGYPPKSDQNDPKKVTKIIKNWLKMMSKKCQKVCFLMAKSSFSVKFT